MAPRPRSATLALLLVALALAGCLGTNPPLQPGPGDGAPPLAALANVQVTSRNGPASEVTLAVNPTDPMNLIGGAKDYTLGSDPGPGCAQYNVWSGVYWSKDGGRTWGNALMPGYPGDANTTLLSHYRCNSDPVVVFGVDGTAYYSGLAYGGAPGTPGDRGVCPGDQAAPLCGGSIWIARSTDGGATWEQFVNVAVSDDAAGIGLDKQWFATDPTDAQHLVMTWIQFTGLAAYFLISESRDGAATWSPPVTLAELGTPLHQFAMPAFGPDGIVYVVWHQFETVGGALPVNPVAAAQSSVLLTKSEAPDVFAFPPARAIATMTDIVSPLPNSEFRTTSIPTLVADTSGGARAGTLYVSWANMMDCAPGATPLDAPDCSQGHADIVVISSSDGGETWTQPAVVNQDGTPTDQFMTWSTVDEEGGLDVLFYDRSYTASPANTLLDITVARSTDGGATFRSVRVTPQSWAVPEGCYHQNGFPFIGDYVGLVAANGTLHGLWADGRSGRCEVETAAIPYTAFGGAAGNAAAGNATARTG